MAFLDDIAKEKMREARLRRGFIEESPDPLRRRGSLVEAVAKPGLSFICEIKRASPTEGQIRDVDAAATARAYEAAGADAISVLTDGRHFGGRLEDLDAVKSTCGLPVLRKDFIVDVQQIRDAHSFGADAVLLIAALLKDRTGEFVEFADYVGLESLVEVHDESELAYALPSGARLIGINNRDLKTLKVDMGTFERIAPRVPDDRLIVAESGIRTREDAQRMRKAGADAVLVGSSLMKSANIAEKLKELSR